MAAAFAVLLCAVLVVAPSARASYHRLHAFYYAWYQTPEQDGRYAHWNHSVLPHWAPDIRAQHPQATFIPPHDIHAPFYPARGLYSSSNESVMLAHMHEMRAAGIGVAVVSWWGRPTVSSGDSQGVQTDGLLGSLLEAAHKAHIQIALHLEPYVSRSVASVALDVRHIIDAHGTHPALYKMQHTRTTRPLPLFYVYDSYHIPAAEWASFLTPTGAISVRGTDYDGIFFGLWLKASHGRELLDGGFDGAYTYFASAGFSYGSTLHHWPAMASYCSDNGMLFVPSVAPGYDDSKIRPWNAVNRKERDGGRYYAFMWEAAKASGAAIVSITSFNEWGEGTQIEPAVPRIIPVEQLSPQGLALDRETREALHLADRYEDYLPHEETHYLEETRRYAAQMWARRQRVDGEEVEDENSNGRWVRANATEAVVKEDGAVRTGTV